MDKEAVVLIHDGILISIKRNTFESALLRWMNLEPIIQSEVSQKEKDKYHILMKAERQKIDAFELWCWRRLLRVPWTARRSNQSNLEV